MFINDSLENNNIASPIITALKSKQKAVVYRVCQEEFYTGEVVLTRISNLIVLLKKEGVSSDIKVLINTTASKGVLLWDIIIALWCIGACPMIGDFCEEAQSNILKKTSCSKVINPSEFYNRLSFDENLDIEVHQYDQDRVGLVLFTSGSTGEPKPVPLSHHGLFINACCTAKELPLQQDDELFISIPHRFVSAVSHFLVATLFCRGLIHNSMPSQLSDFVNFINNFSPTTVGGSPVHMRWLANYQEYITSSDKLRWVMSSGDHLHQDTIDLLQEKYPHMLIQIVYGMTEVAGRLCMLSPHKIDTLKESVGKPLDCFEVSLVGEDGTIIRESHSPGMLYVKGSPVFSGYIGIDNNRYFHQSYGFSTGDLAEYDDDGFIYLLGRNDDVFKIPSGKISGKMLADKLKQLPNFKELAVVGIKDPDLGTVAKLYYVLKEGFECDAAEINRYLKTSLSAEYLIAHFQEMTELPRTGSGKFDRKKAASYAN